MFKTVFCTYHYRQLLENKQIDKTINLYMKQEKTALLNVTLVRIDI